jgi:hypothetical protein
MIDERMNAYEPLSAPGLTLSMSARILGLSCRARVYARVIHAHAAIELREGVNGDVPVNRRHLLLTTVLWVVRCALRVLRSRYSCQMLFRSLFPVCDSLVTFPRG